MYYKVTLSVIICFIFSNLYGQNIFDKWKINRSVKLVNNDKLIKADRIITKVHPQENWSKHYMVLYQYPSIIKYISEYSSLFEKDSLIGLKTNMDSLNRIIMKYKGFNADTAWLINKGYEISRVYKINNQIAKHIKNKHTIDSLEHQLSLKKEYETPAMLDSLANIILPKIIDSEYVPPLKGYTDTEYLIEIKREGKNGENLIVKLSLYYKEDLYGYPLGIYRSTALNYPIEIFSRIVKSRIQTKSIIKNIVTGEADANIPYGLYYDGYYGDIEEGDFNILIDSKITNLELAFLRAFNAKMIFESIVHKKIEPIKTIDHILISEENKGIEFRKVTMIAYFFGYFTKQYNELSDKAKESVNIEKKTILIERNNVKIVKE